MPEPSDSNEAIRIDRLEILSRPSFIRGTKWRARNGEQPFARQTINMAFTSRLNGLGNSPVMHIARCNCVVRAYASL